MDLTPKQQTSEAIRQAETIVILTGQHPSVDQTVAVMALAAILRKFGKTVTPVISDNPPASVAALDLGGTERGLGGSRDFVLKLDVTKAEVDKLRYEVADGKLNIYLTPFKGGFAPSDVTFGYGESIINYDLAIVLGVPARARIDRIYEQNSASFDTIPVVNLDFHRSNENYGAVNLIEPNASSLCEMLVALSESLQSGIIDGEIATALLMGIVASTDRFTAAHTSPKSLTVAAQMMAAGARQQTVVKALYRDGKAEGRGSERGGAERGGERAGERDRNDRNDRGERSSGDRNSGDRNERTNQDRGERSSQDRGERHAAPQSGQPRVQAQPAHAPAAQAASHSAPRTEERHTQVPPPRSQERQPEPVQHEAQPQREDYYSEADLPIIQPSHIEMSEPEPAPAPAAVPPVAAPIPEPALRPQPAAPQSAPAENPQTRIIADFAAASEMFNSVQAKPASTSDRDAS